MASKKPTKPKAKKPRGRKAVAKRKAPSDNNGRNNGKQASADTTQPAGISERTADPRASDGGIKGPPPTDSIDGSTERGAACGVRGPLPDPLPPGSRPTEYDPSLAQEILELLADGLTLNAICADKRFPAPRTVRRWAMNVSHPFAPLYARAREVGYHSIADDIFDQADDGRNDWMERNDPDNPGWAFNGENVQRSKLRVETRKWFLSKCLPKIYGDKVDLNLNHTFTHQFEEYIRSINADRDAQPIEAKSRDVVVFANGHANGSTAIVPSVDRRRAWRE